MGPQIGHPGHVQPIRPMLATAGELPTGDGWAFEFKWDGVRAITHVRDGEARAFSRNDLDITGSYPELNDLAGLVPGSCVLDGEIVSFDHRGRPSFGLLQSRMHVRAPSRELRRRVPVRYLVFDLLRVDGESLLRTPYAERRERLARLGLDSHRHVSVSPFFADADGRDVLAAAREQGLEGVVAKRLDSVYEPGRRSRAWVKVPLVFRQEVVVGGWRPGEGSREGTIGALLLGAYDETGLRYIGDVGTGFDGATLRDLQRRLDALRADACPFVDSVPRDRARHARWVEPRLVGEVAYRSWTLEHRLRQSSWQGLRMDKEPHEVVLG
jgi:bifunctional non-homologous end joining protein LigD